MFTCHPLFPKKYEPWQAFIATNVNYVTEWGDLEKQIKWGKLCLVAVQRCDHWLKKEGIYEKTLLEIYNFCANERLKIARVLGHDLEYGMSRFDPHSPYSFRTSIFTPDRLRTKGQFAELKSRFEKLAGQQSQVSIKYEGIAEPVLTIRYVHKVDGVSSERLEVDYPRANVATQLMDKAHKIWKETLTLKERLSREEKDSRLYKILCHFAIACPLLKGSAGASELLHQILRNQLKLPLLPMKSEKSWDIFSFFSSNPEDYATWALENLTYSTSDELSVEFQLPAFDYASDSTEPLEQEAARLVKTVVDNHKDLGSRNYSSNPIDLIEYNHTDLKDPYGLSLLHHFILYILKNFPLKDYLRTNQLIPMVFKYTMTGKHMLLDAYKIGANHPFTFLINCGIAVHRLPRLLQDCPRFELIDPLQERINLFTKWLNKFLTDIKFVYSGFNEEIINKAAALQQSFNSILQQSFNTWSSDLDKWLKTQLKELYFLIEHSRFPLPFIQLIQFASVHPDPRYLEGLTANDWITPRAELRNITLLDAVMTLENFSPLVSILKTLKNKKENIHPLLDYGVRSKYATSFLGVLVQSLNLVELQTWLIASKQRYPDNQLLSALSKVSDLPTDDGTYVEIFLKNAVDAEIHQRDHNKKTPLYNAFDSRNFNLVIALVKRGATIGENVPLDRNIRDKVKYFLYDVHYEVYIKEQICNDLHPQDLKCFIADALQDEIRNFCIVLNAIITLTNSSFEKIPNFFASPRTPNTKYTITEGLCALITQNKYRELSSYLNYLINLELEHYVKLKTCLTDHLADSPSLEDYSDAVDLIEEKIDRMQP